MEEKERYYYKKILRDCVIPEGLYEIKDRESDFYLIIENKKDVDTIINLLNQQDKESQQLKQQLDKVDFPSIKMRVIWEFFMLDYKIRKEGKYYEIYC